MDGVSNVVQINIVVIKNNMNIAILLAAINITLSAIALWYRHSDKKERHFKDALGDLKYAEPQRPTEHWLCRSALYPMLTGEGRTSQDARFDLYSKYQRYHKYKEYINVK